MSTKQGIQDKKKKDYTKIGGKEQASMLYLQ